MKVGTHEKSYRTFVGNSIYVSVPGLIDPRVRPQFQQSLLHWSQISFPEAFFLGQYRADSHWGLNLENMMNGEAIRSLINSI